MNQYNTNPKTPVLALDIGSGFVKACFGEHNKVSFPSLYGYREAIEDEKGIIEAVGDDVLSLQDYPTVVILRAVSEGMPLSEKAFRALLREAVKRLKIPESEIPGITAVIGIPYNNRNQKEQLRKLVMSTIKPSSCLCVSQSLGTLIYESKRTGIVVSLGQGTTELVYYKNLKSVLGKSLRTATDFLHLGNDKLAYIRKHDKISKQRIQALADIIADELNTITSQIPTTPDVILSGGGILIDGMYKTIQEKVKEIGLVVSNNPVYSNVLGLSRLLEITQTETQTAAP